MDIRDRPAYNLHHRWASRVAPEEPDSLTGLRPSEASALEWSDIDLTAGRIWITKSRSRGAVAAPKTARSHRQIQVSPELVEVLKLLPSLALGLKAVFVNKYGDPVDSRKWGEWYLTGALKKLGIRHRKAYAMRHTFITETVRAGYNLKAIADIAAHRWQ
jgi:integrase